MNHTIISVSVKDLDECEYRCYLNANCVSLNIRDHHNGTHECELNNSTHLEHDGHLKDSELYYYRGAEVRVIIFVLTFRRQLSKKRFYTKDNGHISSPQKSLYWCIHSRLKAADQIPRVK